MSKERILIVEDEMIIALGIQKTLERLGYVVPGIAATGADAVAMARDLSPDLILMDIILGGEIDGIEAARRIRERADRPIIYLTANADPATVERARDTQPYGYLNKPVNERDLMSNIDTALHKHRMERRLRESEEKYRTLIESLNDIVISTDEQGIVTYISPQIREISGFDGSDLVGKNFSAFMHPDDLWIAVEMFEGAMRGEKREGIYRAISKSGDELWLRVSGGPVFVEGRFSGVRGVISDITARKRAEDEIGRQHEELQAANEELQAANEELEATNEAFESQNRQLLEARDKLAAHEARLSGILRVAPVGIIFVEKGDRFGWANQRLHEITGYSWEEIEGRSPMMLFADEDEPRRVQKELQRQLAGSGTGTVETRMKRRDGMLIDVLLNATLIEPGNREAGAVMTLMDITERRRAEESLAESEKKYRLLADNVSDSIWILDLATMSFVYNSPSSINILGYTEQESLGLTPEKVVTGDSLDRAMKILAGELARDGEPGVDPDRSMTLELEQIHKDGHIVWTEVSVRPLRDEKGAPTGILGVSRDISERKKAERALAESEKKYRFLAENISDNIFILDLATLKFLYSSPSATPMLGYSETESLELAARDVVTGESLARVTKIVGEELARDGQPGVDPDRTRTMELEQIHRDGHIVWTEVNAKLLRNESGTAIGILGVSRDITGRRREEALIRMQRDLAQELSAITDLDEALRIGLDIAIRGANMDCGGIYLASRDTGDMYLACHHGLGDDFVRAANRIPADSPNMRLMKAARSTFASRYADIGLQQNRATRAEGLLASAVIPLWHDGEPIACMNIASHRIADIAYVERDYLETIATVIGNVLVRLEIQDSLRVSEEKFRLMIENAPFPIAVADDATGALTYANRSFEETLGYTAAMLPSMDAWWSAAFPDERYRKTIRTKLVRGVKAARSGRTSDQFLEADIRCADGTYRRIEIHMVYLRDLWYFIMNDLTQKKINEEMMIQSEKMLSLGGLAAGMAHEINNPLGVILQGTQGALERLSPEVKKNREAAEKAGTDLETVLKYLEQRDVLEYLHGVRDAGKRAAKIVENMLQFSRRGESEIRPVDINALVDRAIEIASYDYDLKKRYDFRKITISRSYGSLPPVPCSETGMEQVVFNLLKNSAQALAALKKRGRRPEITVRTRARGRWAVIDITDNGPGIPADIQKHIFEPFYTTKGSGAGTGLGLSVSKFIVTETHNGAITVKSEPGQGTSFTIRLPLRREDGE